MVKKLFVGLIALCTMLAMGLVGCSAPEVPSGTEEGEIYRTKAVTSGSVGAYFSFKVYPEGEKNEWDLTGNVYEMNVSAWGREYSMWNAGYWELDGDTLSLTPTNQDEPTKSNPTLIVDSTVNEAKTFTAVDGAFTIPIKAYGEDITIVFDPETDKVGENSEPPCVSHVDEDGDGKCDVCGEDMPEVQPPEQGAEPDVFLESEENATGQQVRLDLFNADTSWKLYVIYAEGMEYMYAMGGTFILNADYSMTLTVTDDQAEMSGSDTLTTVMVDTSGYPDLKYSCNISLNIPQMGVATFELENRKEEDKEEHYIVTFDWNYDGAEKVQIETVTFTDADGAKYQYIDREYDWQLGEGEELKLKVPEREGYLFAGWDYKKTPVLEDGASTSEYFIGQRVSSWYPSDTPNYVCSITGNTIIYARWVEATHIKDEAGLRAMANDLGGWYILDNDITLTEEWTPIGKYYSVYEYIDSSWWKYAFDGIFDGNGHTINGLVINTLTPYADEDVEDIGNANGTTAMFGAVAAGEIKNVTLNAPRISISNYSNRHHAYVSVLVAFSMDSTCIFENCDVTDADIFVSVEDVDYISVAGIISGHWGGDLKNCTMSGTVKVIANYTREYEGETVNIYLGQLAGENYEHITGCTANAEVELTVNDARDENLTQTSAINVFAGGAGGSSAFSQDLTIGGKLKIDTSNVLKNKVVGQVGGVGGSQKYGLINGCSVSMQIELCIGNKTEQNFVCGQIIGTYDLLYAVQRLQYEGDVKVRNCDGESALLDVNGESATFNVIGHIPTKEEINAMKDIFTLIGVDISQYENSETGEYDIFGVA